MSRDGAGAIEQGEVAAEQVERHSHRRAYRLVPPAVTPLRVGDITAGVASHARGRGRDQFRAAVGSTLDAESTATYSSFRRALGACLLALSERSPARETVLLPAFCSADFHKTVEGVGLEYRRYDVDARSFGADLDAVGDAVDDDVLAVVAVNVLGYSSRMDEFASRCEAQGVPLVEALGYALGSEYDGQPLGTFGDCAVCNFQQGKPVPVGGGMVVSQDRELAFSDDGRPAVSPNVATLSGYAAFGRPRLYYLYRRVARAVENRREGGDRISTHPGSKLRVDYSAPFRTMSNFQGAVARRVLGRNATYRRERASTARYYTRSLGDCAGVRRVTPVEGLSEHQFVRFPLVAENEALRDRIIAALRDAGIGSTTLYDWPVLDPEQFPEASRLQRRTLTLPTHPFVDEHDLQTVVGTVRNAVRESTTGAD